jgi:hypothetical protein
MAFEFCKVVLETINPERKNSGLAFLYQIESDSAKIEFLKAS